MNSCDYNISDQMNAHLSVAICSSTDGEFCTVKTNKVTVFLSYTDSQRQACNNDL